MDYTKLFHNKNVFSREYLQDRMKQNGFKNLSRMELFLWDLELFLQVQKRLGENIILKGGAATQFYLPIEAQRTSVDIDMLFCGTVEQIEATLNDITNELNNNDDFFLFNKHIPKKPKTNLPLHTYYVNVPSILSYKELNAKESIINGPKIF